MRMFGWFKTAVFLLIAALPLTALDDPLAHSLLDQGRADEAVVLLKHQLRSTPENAQAYNLLCRVYLSVDRWNAAVDACEQAVKLDPANSEYHLWLGRSYGKKAEHAWALAAARIAGNVRDQFEIAVRLDPKSVDARDDLADFYMEAPSIVGGGETKAEDQAREIEKLEPSQGDLVRARIAEKRKDFSEAANQCNRAIRESGGAPGPWLELARVYRHTSRFAEMDDAILHATGSKGSRPDVLISAAQILIQSDHNLGQAEHFLQRYLASPTPSEDAPVFKAHYLLGTLLERRGQPEQAVTEYQAALTLAANFAPARSALERLTNRAGNEGIR